MLWRNTASFPDTPCAPASPRNTLASSAIVTTAIPMRLPTLIPSMTVVARYVDRVARRENIVGALGFRGLESHFRGIDHRLRHLDPFALVDGAAFHHEQVPRFGQRDGAVPDGF